MINDLKAFFNDILSIVYAGVKALILNGFVRMIKKQWRNGLKAFNVRLKNMGFNPRISTISMKQAFKLGLAKISGLLHVSHVEKLYLETIQIVNMTVVEAIPTDGFTVPPLILLRVQLIL
jgi:hypothetical protein